MGWGAPAARLQVSGWSGGSRGAMSSALRMASAVLAAAAKEVEAGELLGAAGGESESAAGAACKMERCESLGPEERWHRSLQEEVRALKQLIGNDPKTEIAETSPVCTWLVRHSAWLYMRFQTSRTRGGTGFSRVRGHPYAGRIANVGVMSTLSVLMASLDDVGAFAGTRWVTGASVLRTRSCESPQSHGAFDRDL